MKEVLTIELDRNDIVDAIADLLKQKGYEVKKVDFKFRRSMFQDVIVVDCASVTVTKETKMGGI